MFLTFTINVTAGSITLADLGNRTYTTGTYDIGQEYHIDDIRYSTSLAAAIFAGSVTATDSLGQSITAQGTLALTEEFLNKAGHAQSTDALPQGATNKYYDDALVGNFINVGVGSTPYLNFNSSTGQLDIKALAITDVVVDTTYASIGAWETAEYTTGTLLEEGDVVILTAATGGPQVWINNGLNTLTVTDWTKIEAPNLSDAYIRGLFTVNPSSPLTYNSLTGEFNSLYDGVTIKLNSAGELYVDSALIPNGTANQTLRWNSVTSNWEAQSTLLVDGNATTNFASILSTGINVESTSGGTAIKIHNTNGNFDNGMYVGGDSMYIRASNSGDGWDTRLTLNATNATFSTGINIGNLADTTAGNIRWNGVNFQGYDGSVWKNLDEAGNLIAGEAISIPTDDSINVLYDNVTIGINDPISNQLYVKDLGIGSAQLAADSVNDLKIDWGTGANQVNAADMPIVTHTWVAIGTPSDVQDALEKLDAEISGAYSWRLGASSNNGNVTNRFIEREGGTRTNQSPYILWYDCTLKAMSLSANSATTWTAEIYKNGASVATLASGGAASAYNGSLNVSFAAGDKVSMYVTGTGADRPSIDALFVRNPA